MYRFVNSFMVFYRLTTVFHVDRGRSRLVRVSRCARLLWLCACLVSRVRNTAPSRSVEIQRRPFERLLISSRIFDSPTHSFY